MGFYTGRTGQLCYGDTNTQVAKIRDWSIQTTLELLSTNDLESGYNTYTPGVAGASGSATMMYYRPDTGDADFIKVINRLMKDDTDTPKRVGEGDRIKLKLKVGSNDADQIEFNAYITSATVSVSTGELVVVPIEFTMDGNFIKDLKKALV